MTTNNSQPHPAAPPTSHAIEAGLDIWGLFARHSKLLIAVVLIAAGGSYIYFEQMAPLYESMGRLVVMREGNNALPVHGLEGSNSAEDNLSTQGLLIRSPVIVQIAVEKSDLRNLASLAGVRDPVRFIASRVSVKPTEVTATVLDIGFRGPNAGDCATIVNAVMDAYREYLDSTQTTEAGETLKIITEAKDILLAQLQKKEDEYRQFRQLSPLHWKGEERMNLHHGRLVEIERSRAQLVLARSELTSLLQSVESAAGRGDNREALLLMMERLKGSESSSLDERTLQGDIIPLLLEEAVLLQDLGPEHPKVATVRKRIEMTRSLYNLPDTGTTELPSARKRSTDFLRVYTDSLRRQVATTEKREEVLNELFNKERDAAKALMDIEMQDEGYRNEIFRMRQLFEAVVKRLQELSLFKEQGGYKAQVISSAVPGWQVEPNFFRIMVMGCVIGLFAGVAGAYLLEMGDKTFRTPDEISQALELPILGHIAKITVSRKAYKAARCRLHNTLVTYYEARSRGSEAFRSIRTALAFIIYQNKFKVLQITSPGPNEGKSTVIANLAVSLAHAGKNVLLIEADLRRPTVHQLFGVDPTYGTTNVLDGSMEPQEVIQATDARNVWVMPCGYQPENPAEMLSHPRFKEMLDFLSPKYDLILVDSPPLLAVSDACVVATCVDGVLLALRIDKKMRNCAIRAREMLTMFHANVLGVIVNCGDASTPNSYAGGYTWDYPDAASSYYNEASSVAVPLRIEQEASPAGLQSNPISPG
jgi:capsular exopolysaccharide synthesis family protein